MRCTADTTIQYSLYLPKQFNAGSSYPLLIFLDPAARGNMPVEKYRQIADEENIILAGSFSSKNFDMAASLKAIPAMLTDIKARLLIKEEAIWLGGFSGGSRMAAAYAAAYEGIRGVIACGAGFAKGVLEEGNEFHTMRKEVPYAALVGDKDMNFEEMTDVTDVLSKRNKRNILLVFDGGHEWPPVLQMQLAVNWLSTTAGIPQKGQNGNMAAALTSQYKKYSDADLIYFGWLTANSGKQIPSIASVSDSLAALAIKAKNYKRDKELFETVLTEERNFMDQFSFLYDQVISSDKIQADNDELWRQKAAAIAQLKKDKNPYRQLSGQRIYDICWRLCSEQYSWLMETGKFKAAYSSAYIASFLEPPYINPDYMQARAAAGMGDKELCYARLKKAMKKGNLQKERVLNDKYITGVLSVKELEKLMGN
jgi:predicted esterase